MFYPGEHVVELCERCANTVWCLINVYEDGSKELSSIHHNEESAVWFKSQNWELINKLNPERENKIIDQLIEEWIIL